MTLYIMKGLKILFLLLTFWNIPFLILRIYKFKLQKLKNTSNLKWKYFQNLPSEVLSKICFYSGIIEVYRLGRCCKNLYKISKDEILWEKKFYWDFFTKSMIKKLELDYRNLYKSRYLIKVKIRIYY